MSRKPIKGKSLAEVNPELIKQWHPKKNGDLTPWDVTYGTARKVWWQCYNNSNHEFIARIDLRNHGRNCPYCTGQKVLKEESFGVMCPELLLDWNYDKNSFSPYEVTQNSGRKIWWNCSVNNNHNWQSSIDNRRKGKGCPYCSGNKTDESNSLHFKNPTLSKEWHPTLNGELKPSDVTEKSEKIAWWKCPNGEDHEWKTKISHRSNGSGCPICKNLKIVDSNSLGVLNNNLAKEWHPTKNGALSPFDVGLGTHKKVWWKCPKGEDHEWKASIVSRMDRNCPFCTLTPQSRQELLITFELKQFFDIDPKGFKTRVQGKLWSIDIYLPELNLGIEFDGSYWHKDKSDLDKLKTEQLNSEGFQIMRIREEPLKPITKIDVISKRPFNPKQVTNDVLNHIIQAYELDSERGQKISKYIKQKSIQNEKALDEYVEIILYEKSEKKRIRTTTVL